jgi:hypothetical protein
MIMTLRILGIMTMISGGFIGGGMYSGKLPFDQALLLVVCTGMMIGFVLAFADQFPKLSTVIFIVAGLTTLISGMMYLIPELSPGPDLVPILLKVKQFAFTEDTIVTEYMWWGVLGINVSLWTSAVVLKLRFD